MFNKILFLLIILAQTSLSFSQLSYSKKSFVTQDNPDVFERIVPKKNGFMRTYITATVTLWDIDDRKTTLVNYNSEVLLCIEGQYKKEQREGIYNVFVLDSTDHSKKYKIWEQNYSNNKLNGEWKTFSLSGPLVEINNYKDDILSGTSKRFWINGNIIQERTFYSENNYLVKEYTREGIIKEETTILNDRPHGPAKKYYPNGTLMDEVNFENGILHGARKYYYPSGKIWTEMEFNKGKPHTVIANYTEAGEKRNPGTLKEGNGTVILYDEDGSIRETIHYRNGFEVK